MESNQSEAKPTERSEVIPVADATQSSNQADLSKHQSQDKNTHNCKKTKSKAKSGKKSKSKAKDFSESDSSEEYSSNSDSDATELTDTSSSEDSSDDDDDSESDSEDEKKKRRKSKLKKKAKQKAKDKKRRKAKRKARRDVSSDSESDSETESDETISESEEEEEEDEENEEIEKVLRNRERLGLSGSLRRGRGLRSRIVRPPPVQRSKKQLVAELAALGIETKPIKSRKEKKKQRKRASKLEFKRVDQLWDNTIHNYKLSDTTGDEESSEYDQYLFTIRRTFDWEGKFKQTWVDIKSKLLREALAEIMDGVKGVSLVEDTPALDPNTLFLYLEDLRDSMKALKSKLKNEKMKRKHKKKAESKLKHMKVLIKYLDKDYAETKKSLYPMLESGIISFDLLWALYKPNTLAYTSTYDAADEPRAFKIEYAEKQYSFMQGESYSIEGRYLEYDGKTWGMGTMESEVSNFKGARKITSLSCYPLKFHKDETKIRAELIARGKKFVSLQGVNYRSMNGLAFYKKKRQIVKVNVNGRIMVDPAIHRRMLPNYQISTVKPKDPDILDDSDDDDSDCCNCGEDSEHENAGPSFEDLDEEKTRRKVVVDDKNQEHIIQVPVDAEGNELKVEKLEELKNKESTSAGEADKKALPVFTDEEYLIASPVVLGFAFSEKLWLEFTVSGVQDIIWNEGAYESLVLPENTKQIVKALVESHTHHAAESIDDVIQGKGKGLVAVLHGPPGTGKTLTAEGISELLKCPLYMVSAGELGTDPNRLEGELQKILDIAHAWGAVLLLDEADVFLEKRTIQDIHRNALVSIFLRLLEYFQGILFLTTNRVETFDDAFQSRIHIALRYGELTTKAKKSVFKMFLERVRVMEGVATMPFTEEDLDRLARHDLNGRQIKNTVRTAQALAVNKKEPLSIEHIRRVLDVLLSFDRDLKGGTGYEDAMKHYM